MQDFGVDEVREALTVAKDKKLAVRRIAEQAGVEEWRIYALKGESKTRLPPGDWERLCQVLIDYGYLDERDLSPPKQSAQMLPDESPRAAFARIINRIAAKFADEQCPIDEAKSALVSVIEIIAPDRKFSQ
jgi:hypothetical protein